MRLVILTRRRLLLALPLASLAFALISLDSVDTEVFGPLALFLPAVGLALSVVSKRARAGAFPVYASLPLRRDDAVASIWFEHVLVIPILWAAPLLVVYACASRLFLHSWRVSGVLVSATLLAMGVTVALLAFGPRLTRNRSTEIAPHLGHILRIMAVPAIAGMAHLLVLLLILSATEGSLGILDMPGVGLRTMEAVACLAGVGMLVASWRRSRNRIESLLSPRGEQSSTRRWRPAGTEVRFPSHGLPMLPTWVYSGEMFLTPLLIGCGAIVLAVVTMDRSEPTTSVFFLQSRIIQTGFCLFVAGMYGLPCVYKYGTLRVYRSLPMTSSRLALFLMTLPWLGVAIFPLPLVGLVSITGQLPILAATICALYILGVAMGIAGLTILTAYYGRFSAALPMLVGWLIGISWVSFFLHNMDRTAPLIPGFSAPSFWAIIAISLVLPVLSYAVMRRAIQSSDTMYRPLSDVEIVFDLLHAIARRFTRFVHWPQGAQKTQKASQN